MLSEGTAWVGFFSSRAALRKCNFFPRDQLRPEELMPKLLRDATLRGRCYIIGWREHTQHDISPVCAAHIHQAETLTECDLQLTEARVYS